MSNVKLPFVLPAHTASHLFSHNCFKTCHPAGPRLQFKLQIFVICLLYRHTEYKSQRQRASLLSRIETGAAHQIQISCSNIKQDSVAALLISPLRCLRKNILSTVQLYYTKIVCYQSALILLPVSKHSARTKHRPTPSLSPTSKSILCSGVVRF